MSPQDVSSRATPHTLTAEPAVLGSLFALPASRQGIGSLSTGLALSKAQQVSQGYALGALAFLYFCLPLPELGPILPLSP